MTDTAVNQPGVIYLEPDDEIPSVVRRLRDAGADRVVLVAPGRTKATSSAIGLRLLARHATAAGRSLALVAEQASRALANEAGIPAFATVAEAQAEAADPAGSSEPARPRARIHVVRGERAGLAALAAVSVGAGEPVAPVHASRGVAPAAAAARLDETQAVPVVAPPRASRVARPRARRAARLGGRATAIAVVATLVVAAGVVAAVLPAASVTIMPAVAVVGPVAYTVELPSQEESGQLAASQSARTSGTYEDSKPSRGAVTFANYSSQKVVVPMGTRVSAGDHVYTTDVAVTVPRARQFGVGSTADVAITAETPGPSGNVDTGAIDTIQDADVRSSLCAQFFICTNRLVANRAPVTGGATKSGPQVTQKDVDGLIAALKASLQDKLQAALAAHPDRMYAPPESPQVAAIAVPKDLVGTKDKPTFELSGSLAYDQRYLTTDQLHQAGVERLTADATVLAGRQVVPSSVLVEASKLRASGDFVQADLSVRGGVTPPINTEQLKSQIAGMSRGDAARALARWGTPSISLWPSWVDAIPRLGFRVQIALQAPSVSPAPSPDSATATP